MLLSDQLIKISRIYLQSLYQGLKVSIALLYFKFLVKSFLSITNNLTLKSFVSILVYRGLERSGKAHCCPVLGLFM